MLKQKEYKNLMKREAIFIAIITIKYIYDLFGNFEVLIPILIKNTTVFALVLYICFTKFQSK